MQGGAGGSVLAAGGGHLSVKTAADGQGVGEGFRLFAVASGQPQVRGARPGGEGPAGLFEGVFGPGGDGEMGAVAELDVAGGELLLVADEVLAVLFALHRVEHPALGS